MPDRPSREYRLVHEADTGLPLLEPVTDPPEAPDRETPANPPASPSRASVAPPRAQSWALVLVAVLGAGGAPSLVQAVRGDGGQAEATAALTAEVQRLSGSVARLEGELRTTSERLTELRATVEAREQERRQQLEVARAHLRQPPRPDVPGALRALE